MIDIRNLSKENLNTAVVGLGEKSFRAKQIWEWLWKKGARSFNDMKTLPSGFRTTLAETYFIHPITIDTLQKSEDKTTKLRFELVDGHKVEGVLIPSSSRTTACISTQSGCPLGCKFCATGQFGFHRNLSIGEIFDQVSILNDLSITQFQKPLSNIVIMGMGEPFLNYEATMGAIQHITSVDGMGMSPKRITLSTAGLVPEINKFAEADCGVQLAISLHSANQKIRETIMPIAKKFSLIDLIGALKQYHLKTNERITIEYLLMEGVNDTLDDAHELANFCKNFPVKINLIAYNEVAGIEYKKSTTETITDFGAFLENRNLIVNIRRSRGIDIAAACGQLANKK